MAEWEQDPATVDISVRAGDDMLTQITLTEDGNPYIFAGKTLEAAVFKTSDLKKKNPTALATLTVISPSDGVILVSTTDTVTGTTLGVGSYSWAASATESGYTRTILSGAFIVETRA
jgi:hypothetical protein